MQETAAFGIEKSRLRCLKLGRIAVTPRARYGLAMASLNTVRPCRVAAVQMESRPGDIAGNLGKAEAHIVHAAREKAELVLLPELMASGYQTSPMMWDDAEAIGGPLTRWLCGTARRLRIHLGTSLIEASGGHFYNTFLLATPSGDLAGSVRKSHPAWVEARYYRGDKGPHTIETELGRIGVGICYENYLASRTRELARANIDFLLQPTAAATPPPLWPVGRRGAQAFEVMLASLAQHHAEMLAVPVVMANMCGPLSSPLPGFLGQLNTRFPGMSSIVDGSGQVVARLGGAEGVAIATVMLGSARERRANRPAGRWTTKMPWYAFAWPLIEAVCARAYERDRVRQIAAKRRSAD
jgi:N-carbamoylputrescine amidase